MNYFTRIISAFCALGATATLAATPIHFLGASHGLSVPQSFIVRQIRANFDVESYRELKVQTFGNLLRQPDHLVISLLARGFHRISLVRVNLDAQFKFLNVVPNYHLSPEDEQQQSGPHQSGEAKCPDASVQFIAFAPNDDELEQQVTQEVAKAAQAGHLKTVYLAQTQATRQNYLNYMSCPALVGNFYDGDANTTEIAVVDGTISSQDFVRVLPSAFREKVTNIWLACEAYNEPMLSAVQKTAESQKYAAGINDLEVGPSDHTAACAMEAAIQGKPMTAAFWDCYNRLDSTGDKWGFAGSGSDVFGAPTSARKLFF